MDQDVAFATALEQADLLRGGDVSPTELVELYLERIERIEPVARRVHHGGGRLRARRRDARPSASSPRGEHVARRSSASRSRSRTSTTPRASARRTRPRRGHDRVPDYDDDTVARIRRAGFVIIGKTITPEFGLPNISEPPAYPPGRNPWNPELSCGGSSGGAASAIAAGLCPISQGSDGGGSIRNPVVVVRDGRAQAVAGRVSHAPRPEHVLLDQRAAGPHRRRRRRAARRDVGLRERRRVLGAAARPTVRRRGRRRPGRLRVAFHPHPGVEADACAPACAAAARDTAKLLEELGHHVEEATPPVIDAGAADAGRRSSSPVNFAAGSRPDELPPIETMAPWFQTMSTVGSSVSGVDYVARDGRRARRDPARRRVVRRLRPAASRRPSRSRRRPWACSARTPTSWSRCPACSRSRRSPRCGTRPASPRSSLPARDGRVTACPSACRSSAARPPRRRSSRVGAQRRGGPPVARPPAPDLLNRLS